MEKEFLKSPFFFSIKYFKSHPEKHSKHIDYIACRPGASLEKEISSDVEDLDKEVFTQYLHERPKSHGLFGEDGEADLKLAKNEIAEHQGTSWRMIISLNEEDAQRLGYTNKEKWATMIRTSVGQTADEIGIKRTNLQWYAAFHEEKGHPHAHIIMWDRSDTTAKTKLSPYEIRNMKKVFVKEIYKDEKLMLNQEKTAMRDTMRNMSKEEIRVLKENLKEIEEQHFFKKNINGENNASIAPKLRSDQERKTAKMLSELNEVLPEKGRLAYKLLPAEAKEKIDEVLKGYLDQPQFQEYLQRYDEAVKRMAMIYTKDEKQLDTAVENGRIDIEKRMAQTLLQGCKVIKEKSFITIEPKHFKQAMNEIANASGKLTDTNLKDTAKIIANTLKNSSIDQVEQKYIFEKWAEKVEFQEKDFWKSHQKTEIEENIEKTAKIIKLAGLDIESYLTKITTNSEHLQNVKELIKVDELSLKDWNELTKLVNFDSKNESPINIHADFEKIEDSAIKTAREKMLTQIQAATIQEDTKNMSLKELNRFLFITSAGLKQLGVDEQERTKLLTDWATKNNLPKLENIERTVRAASKDLLDESGKIKYLKEETWDSINKFVGTKVEYPFTGKVVKMTTEIDYQKLKTVIEKIQDITDVSDMEQAKKIANIYAKMLTTSNIPTSSVKKNIQEWFFNNKDLTTDKTNEIVDEITMRHSFLTKTQKTLYISDSQQRVLNNLTKSLLLMGKGSEDAQKNIEKWNERSGSNLTQDKIIETIQKQEKAIEEMKAWGKNPTISRNEWDEMNQKLGMQAKWIFKSNIELSNVKDIWKGIWTGIEMEMKKREAMIQMEQQKQQTLEQIKIQKQNERGR
jgi:hypothetical protein